MAVPMTSCMSEPTTATSIIIHNRIRGKRGQPRRHISARCKPVTTPRRALRRCIIRPSRVADSNTHISCNTNRKKARHLVFTVTGTESYVPTLVYALFINTSHILIDWNMRPEETTRQKKKHSMLMPSLFFFCSLCFQCQKRKTGHPMSLYYEQDFSVHIKTPLRTKEHCVASIGSVWTNSKSNARLQK